jgi:hypothetical protein
VSSWLVEGAGTTAANGTYLENGSANGRPKYTQGSYTILWNGISKWSIAGPLGNYYLSAATSDLPANPWTLDTNGAADPPTVSETFPGSSSPSASPSPSSSISASPSLSPSNSPSQSPSQSPSRSPSLSPSYSP